MVVALVMVGSRADAEDDEDDDEDEDDEEAEPSELLVPFKLVLLTSIWWL